MAYISIRDFSQRAGVSPQAIYQRLDKDLLNYIQVVENRKMIEESALELFSVKEPLKQVDKEVDKQIDKIYMMHKEIRPLHLPEDDD